jgi:hypothetical protein
MNFRVPFSTYARAMPSSEKSTFTPNILHCNGL